MNINNKMILKFPSLNENESFARLAVASFCARENLTVEDLSDIKTVVSEAVTNCVVHAYKDSLGMIEIECEITNEKIKIIIKDEGVGIDNVDEAIKPFFTSRPDMERSGMGFTVMEGFMDEMNVESAKNKGTIVTLIKNLAK